jgi:hypothetical protein
VSLKITASNAVAQAEAAANEEAQTSAATTIEFAISLDKLCEEFC